MRFTSNEDLHSSDGPILLKYMAAAYAFLELQRTSGVLSHSEFLFTGTFAN